MAHSITAVIKKELFNIRKFVYMITVSEGLHFRHIGELLKITKCMDSVVALQKNDGTPVSLTKPIALGGLDIKKGDLVTVSVDGGNEVVNANTIIDFFENHF